MRQNTKNEESHRRHRRSKRLKKGIACEHIKMQTNVRKKVKQNMEKLSKTVKFDISRHPKVINKSCLDPVMKRLNAIKKYKRFSSAHYINSLSKFLSNKKYLYIFRVKNINNSVDFSFGTLSKNT